MSSSHDENSDLNPQEGDGETGEGNVGSNESTPVSKYIDPSKTKLYGDLKNTAEHATAFNELDKWLSKNVTRVTATGQKKAANLSMSLIHTLYHTSKLLFQVDQEGYAGHFSYIFRNTGFSAAFGKSAVAKNITSKTYTLADQDTNAIAYLKKTLGFMGGTKLNQDFLPFFNI
jgi:hypothetical protein